MRDVNAGADIGVLLRDKLEQRLLDDVAASDVRFGWSGPRRHLFDMVAKGCNIPSGIAEPGHNAACCFVGAFQAEKFAQRGDESLERAVGVRGPDAQNVLIAHLIERA